MSAAPGLEARVRAAVPLRRPGTTSRSATSPSARPATGRAAAPTRRPALSLVPSRRPRLAVGALARTPFVTLVVALLAAGLLGLLALNTLLAQDAFRLHTLKLDARELEDREQVLEREVEALQAPAALAARATELGMVPAGPPAFLRLPDGKVLGAETAAGEPVPGATVPGGDPAAGTPTTDEAATAEDVAAQEAQQEAAEDAAAVDAVEGEPAEPAPAEAPAGTTAETAPAETQAETPAETQAEVPAGTGADETAGAGQ